MHVSVVFNVSRASNLSVVIVSMSVCFLTLKGNICQGIEDCFAGVLLGAQMSFVLFN
jgi:hypothetical protein